MAEQGGNMRLRFHARRPAFALDVDLSLPAQGISALFGRSGAGKTTLLRCVAGLEPDVPGRFSIGDDIYQDEGRFVPPHRRQFGYVFQQPALFEHLDVLANLRFGEQRARAMDKPLTLERVSALLGLEPLLHRSPHALSGGQQQRVAIGRALLVQPRLLLLDEPLAGLDLESRAEILPCLEALHRELSLPVLYVSHVPMEVQRLADYLVLLEQGAVIASGEINDVLTRPGLALSRADEAAALLDATVQRHDSPFHLTELQTPGGSIYVPAQDLEVGAPLRLRILARDVSIALERIEDTSISNVLEAEIASINEDRDAANRLLQLDVGGTLILSRVTGRSVERLRLRPGMRVFAQVKSVALA
jgi:molybdate transport system ATP-binding protein